MAVTSLRRSGLTNLIKYDRFTAGNESDFALIESITAGSGGASSVTFSNIPQGFRHLQVRCLTRTTGSATNWDLIGLRFNGDSGANYSSHFVYGTGSSAISAAAPNQTYMNVWASGANGMASNIFGVAIVDILDYSNTTKNTTVRVLGGVDTNGNGGVFFTSNAWYNTAAVTSMEFPSAVTNLSTLSLYGIR